MPNLSKDQANTAVTECSDSCKAKEENKRLKDLFKDVFRAFENCIGCIPDDATRGRWDDDVKEYRAMVERVDAKASR